MDKLNRSLEPAPADAPLPGARSTLILLLAINLFNYIDRYVLAAVVPEIQREFDASDAQVGFLATAFLVSYMFAAPVFGWLADRYSRWMLIGIGVIVWSLASGASGLATGIGIMLATRVLVGIGEAAYGPAAPTVISDMYPVSRRGSVLAWFYAAIPVGSALGFLLGGQVLAAGHSWHTAFFIVVPPGILLGIWALWMRDPPRGASDAAPQAGPAGRSPGLSAVAEYKRILRIPSYLLNTAGMAAMTFAVGGFAFWMPKYVVWRQSQAGLLDLTDAEAAKAAAAAASSMIGPITVVAGLAATILGGIAGDRLRPRLSGSYFLVSGVGMLVGFPAFLAMMFLPFPYAWGLFFLACFCVFFNTGPTNTALANVTHPSMRAAAFALNIFIIHALGDAVSPPLIGWINDLSGGNMNAGFGAVSLAMLLSGAFWMWGTKHLQRDTEAAMTLPAAYPVGPGTPETTRP